MEKWNLLDLPDELKVNEKDGSILVKIPEGEFEMGDEEDLDCPKHRIYLNGYCIGMYAVTNRQYKRFVVETGHRAPDEADIGYPVWKERNYPDVYADHPVVCVNWEDAKAYSEWAGLSLATEAQWEKAARGPGNFKYPWGNGWENKALSCMDNNRGSEITASVNASPDRMSGYCLYGTSGNVWEWCLDWYDRKYYESSPPKNPDGPSEGKYRVMRGGIWRNDARLCRSAFRSYTFASIRLTYCGFRLASIAEL
ncbi:MAG: formylglycine-generating enzyme family protein [Deltaproteobacteria bacterium]|nr:formylglycine-generating enzyme family protein [Deltaproteobacteria bacterium]